MGTKDFQKVTNFGFYNTCDLTGFDQARSVVSKLKVRFLLVGVDSKPARNWLSKSKSILEVSLVRLRRPPAAGLESESLLKPL